MSEDWTSRAELAAEAANDTGRDVTLLVKIPAKVLGPTWTDQDLIENAVTYLESIIDRAERDDEDPEYVLNAGDLTVWVEADYLRDLQELEDAKRKTDPGYRPTTTCSCGFELVWICGHWEHDAAPSLWGDDHDADEPEPQGPAREYWDEQDCVS